MVGVKLVGFLGTAPKISPELLPNTAAQVAKNCKLYSGDLIPYPKPVVIGNVGRSGVVKTLFALRDPDTDEKRWLSWATDVDIAVASKTDKDEQRFYYTGDGKPKVSNYDLAARGAAPYPSGYYDLGLPLPPDSSKITATASVFTTKTTVNYTRDASNIVTLELSTPHGIRSGRSISVSGFTYVTGTYVQTGTSRTGTYNEAANTLSITIQVTDHGLANGAVVNLEFSADADINGAYSASVIDKDKFAVTAPTAAARTGTVTWTNSGTTAITVTINNHGLANGASVTLDFTSGTAADGTYTVTNATTNTFDIITTVFQTTSGSVRWDIRNLNAVNVEVTRISDTKLSYFSPGHAVAVTANTSGKVELGGLTQARSYVYTYYTPWAEESIASKPSNELFIKEGVNVVLTNIPTVAPSGGNYFIRGVRVYRTVSAITGSDYFLLQTLWFPIGVAAVQRTGNVATVETIHPHNLDEDDRFKTTGLSLGFNVTDAIVTDVIDDYTFQFNQVGANVPRTLVSSGTLYHDVSENPPTTAARYWGDGGDYSFLDDFESRDLFDILGTDNYDPPPEDLQGLTAIQNNILVGFVGNTLYFSEPDLPHAWPAAYAVNLEHNIVGVAAISGSAIVLTDSYPYLVSGSDPANGMSTARIDANFPCLNRKSIVTMGYGVVYSTHDGLAVYSPSSGPAIITKLLYNNDTWQTNIDPSSVVAAYYGDSYFASHTTGGFVFEQDAKVGGYFVDVTATFSASWYDSVDGVLYYAAGTNGDVYEWDNLSQAKLEQEWKSKVIVTKSPVNLGAARVVADFEPMTMFWDNITTVWENCNFLWNASTGVKFKLWADKTLVYEGEVSDDKMFRLPAGYRSDTYEMSISSDVRVRSIHLAETPAGLKEV
jgi:hypothetical protein